MGKRKEDSNHNRKQRRTAPTRLVDLTDDVKSQLLATAKQRAAEVASQPPREPKSKVPAVIRGLASAMRREDASLSEEAIATGIMEALQPAIMGGDFIAPAPATIARHVKSALSTKPNQEGATAASSSGAAAG